MGELNVLLGKLRNEKNLLQHRISLDSLRMALTDGRMAIERAEDGTIIAIAIVQTMRSCIAQVEIGPIWVDPAYRGRGLSRKVIQDAINLVPYKSCFLIATNDQAASIAQSCGFLEARWLRWHMSCHVNCTLFAERPGVVPVQCRFRGTKERRMFFYHPVTIADAFELL